MLRECWKSFTWHRGENDGRDSSIGTSGMATCGLDHSVEALEAAQAVPLTVLFLLLPFNSTSAGPSVKLRIQARHQLVAADPVADVLVGNRSGWIARPVLAKKVSHR